MTRNFRLLLEEARELGLQADTIYPEKEVAEISDGERKIIVREAFILSDDPSSASITLAKNKEITYHLWERDHVPFPRSYYFKNTSLFPKNAADLDLKFPVVYKKSNGKKSIGVHTNILSFEELSKIINESDGSFIIQEMVFGKEYRLLVFKGRLLGALEMVPPQIIGNGADSIGKLIEKKNSHLQKKIILNEKVAQTLKKNGFSLETIPEKDTCVLLQENSCLAEGGSSIDCTDIVHEDILKLTLTGAKAVNLQLAGLDLICEDISISPEKQKLAFLEANSLPSLDIHHLPTLGKPRRVIRDILKEIFNK
jgi:cyanophycin synthetase